MFGPILSFTYETRQALLSATAEAAARGDAEGLAGYLAASFVRSPSLEPLIRSENVDLAGLLSALNSAPPGESAFDAFQRLINRDPGTCDMPPDAQTQSQQMRRILPTESGTFTSVRMPDRVAAFWKELEKQFGHAPEQSVTPANVLLALLEYDESLRNIFTAHGLRFNALRGHVQDGDAAV